MKTNRYGEGDYEKIEEKSKIFLKRIMGDQKFDAFQRDGKIDILGDNVYELYENGKVINKTKNQSYCIIPSSNDYPKYDIIAMKYAWLTHNPSFAEKVANRTSLDHINYNREPFVRTSRTSVGYVDFVRQMEQRGFRQPENNQFDVNPDYGDYVDYLSNLGWSRELININEKKYTLVDVSKANIGDTTRIAYVRCPAGQKISIMGTQQIPRGGELSVAYSLGLYITDENGKEIPDDTKIRIVKCKPSEFIVQLARTHYSEIKMIKGESQFRFKNGIELNGEQLLQIFLVNSTCNIPSENIKFKIEADMWIRNQ